MSGSRVAQSFALPVSLVISIAFLLFAAPVFAQSNTGLMPVEEITVTARKRAETLQDVPATVTVFNENRIERSNINRASEIALLTPGVSLVDAAEVGDTQVNIRGMNGARDAENSYALVIDGITLTNPAALNREYANLQQIEVLKGPQGAIYGRNASAGAFIITTREPGDELSGQVQAGAGQDDTYNILGNIGGRLTDSIRGSVQGEYFTTDGFYKNEYLDKDDIVDNRENWAVQGRLIFELGDATTLDTKLRYGEVDASSISFNSVFHIPDLAAGFNNPFFYEDVNDHDFRFYSNIEHTNDQESTEFSAKLDHELEFATLTAWTLYSDIENELGADGTSAAFGFFAFDPVCQTTVDRLGLNGANFPLNPPQFIGTNGLAAGVSIGGVDGDSILGAYTPLTCDGTQYQRRNQEDISFEVRLTSNGDGPLQWMGGLYYLNIEREVAVSTGLDNLNAPSYRGATVVQRPYSTDPSNPTDQLVWDDFDTDVYSVFGQIGYDFTDTFTADLALRFDREEREVSSKVPTPGDGATATYINPCEPFAAPGATTPINPGLCDPAALDANGRIPDDSRNFDEFQPKVSFTWDALESTTVFGSWGVGFRSGGFNNSGSEATVDIFINDLLLGPDPDGTLCDPENSPLGRQGCIDSGRSEVGIKDTYDEETSSAFELGFKSDLADGAVRLESAIYYTEVDDMQFFEFVVGPFGLLRVVENIDEVELKGIEASITWGATEWLDLYAGGNYTDSEIKKNETRPDTVGNDSPYTPEYTANLGAYFDFQLTSDLTYFANLDVAAIGDTWFHVVQDQSRPIGFELITGPAPGEYSVAERDSYVLTNLRTGIETENWTFALWVDNLTDEDYLEEVIPAPEFGGSFIHVGTERRVGGDVTYRF
jgi:iron complex outermembrane receptor protein